MPILNRDDAREVERHVRDIFDARDDGRAALVRRLFVEVMDFMPDFGRVSMADAPSSVLLPGSAERVAVLDGVRVFYAALDARRVRTREAVAAANSLARAMGEDMLIVFANGGASEMHFVHPVFGGARPVLRRMVVERGVPRRTAVQQLSNIYWRIQDEGGDVRSALNSAFDVEPVTRRFFEEYDRVFNFAMRAVREARGARESESDAEDRRMFVQTLFNRLTFVYFLSRKGWLRFGGDADYLRALWRSYQNAGDDDDCKNFYYDRLRPLFFGGLNNYRSRDITGGAATPALIGEVPFLNGGLFEYTELDERYRDSVPDEAFELALVALFDKFNFTVTESTPFDVEVAVDPEMLGKMFEELVTGRHDSGAYYTPRGVVSFMCREGLKSYLRRRVPSLDEEALARFVDGRDAAAIPPIEAPAVGTALDEVAVVDPACGSGAYLLGMMQELVELREALYNARQDPRSLYALKLHVIQRSLYGADIDPFAVNIAMLRLWLSLSVDYEGETPEALPNLDFKIVRGDSLTAPDPSAAQGEMSTALIAASGLGELKGEYMRESDGARKAALKARIGSAESDLRQSLGGAAAPAGAVDWRVAFSEVFVKKGGFDVAIANPPYVRQELIKPDEYKSALARMYADAATRRSDLYCHFYARGLQLLADGGAHVFVCSNSWLDVGYGAKLQEHLLNAARVRTIWESAVERQFSTADVNTIISAIEKTSPRDEDETRFVSLRDEFDEAIADANLRREVVKTRRELLEAGLGSANSRGVRKFVGDKWGGKYLRAPSVYHHILNEYSGRLVRLGDVANVGYGIKTGANDFFYLEKKDIAQWGIEPEFLSPVMTSPQESRRIAVDPGTMRRQLFMCHKDKRALARTRALEYIRWGESQGYHRRRSVASRRRWWDLGEWASVTMTMNRVIGNEARTYLFTSAGFVTNVFYTIDTKADAVTGLCGIMNSTLAQLVINLSGRTNFGGGALELALYELTGLSIVNPAHLGEFNYAIFESADWDVMNPSRARLELDTAVFDALGLTVGERECVYEAVRELVGNRLRRAGSV